ncbi:hypothetical protein GTS_33480 [Gandjariella thermophila]|uniref:Uncharacterized protein n=1 Tax=Gandjariella thermophila TaxID=1931992 RepID=A0A4D4J4W2_9PSEU|nr:hypothetical protein GTS_33480 [Gandjariella thermophila]
MTSERAVLAVFLREAEWLLADAAHRIPQGTFALDERHALADVLDRLAAALRRPSAHDAHRPPNHRGPVESPPR